MSCAELSVDIERLRRRVEDLTSGDDQATLDDLEDGLEALRRAQLELERKNMELRARRAELIEGRRAMEMLRAEVGRKNEFLAVLGHELRNPLSAILLATNLLLEGEDKRSRRAAVVEVIRRQAEQLGRLVEDLLEVARTRHGKIVLRKERVDLRHSVIAAAETSSALIEHNRHVLKAPLPEEPIWVLGDPARLRQVIANLLDNSCKYTPPGGHIEVRLRCERGMAVVSVVDDGIGIAPDKLESIFGVFEQVAASAELQGGGLGLGLALVRLLVELHGGTVRASSPGRGGGSEFEIALPLVASAAESRAEPSRPATDAAAAPSARILIVDDNLDAAEMLGLTLRELGYDSIVAGTGHEALERSQNAGCQVALVDLGLPDISGLELAGRLRAQDPDMVLVALTGFGNDRSRHQAEEAGFRHYLLKPAALVEIRRIVDAATR